MSNGCFNIDDWGDVIVKYQCASLLNSSFIERYIDAFCGVSQSSFGADAGCFLSLPPIKKLITPVFLSQEDDSNFNLKVIGKAQAKITFCTAYRILQENDEFLQAVNLN